MSFLQLDVSLRFVHQRPLLHIRSFLSTLQVNAPGSTFYLQQWKETVSCYVEDHTIMLHVNRSASPENVFIVIVTIRTSRAVLVCILLIL